MTDLTDDLDDHRSARIIVTQVHLAEGELRCWGQDRLRLTSTRAKESAVLAKSKFADTF